MGKKTDEAAKSIFAMIAVAGTLVLGGIFGAFVALVGIFLVDWAFPRFFGGCQGLACAWPLLTYMPLGAIAGGVLGLVILARR